MLNTNAQYQAQWLECPALSVHTATGAWMAWVVSVPFIWWWWTCRREGNGNSKACFRALRCCCSSSVKRDCPVGFEHWKRTRECYVKGLWNNFWNFVWVCTQKNHSTLWFKRSTLYQTQIICCHLTKQYFSSLPLAFFPLTKTLRSP